MPEQPHGSRVYWVVYVGLLLLLIATVGLAFSSLRPAVKDTLALGIACAKGLLIVLYFMHVRWQSWLTWFFAGAGFLWLGVLFVLTGSDYVTRNHPAGASPKGEPVYLMQRER